MFLLKTLRRNNNLNKLDNCWCEYRGTLLKNYLPLSDLLVFEGLGHLVKLGNLHLFFFLRQYESLIALIQTLDINCEPLWLERVLYSFIQWTSYFCCLQYKVCVWNGLPALESHAWLAVLCNFIIIWAMHLISHLIWQINSSPQFNRWQGQIQQGDLHWVSSVG